MSEEAKFTPGTWQANEDNGVVFTRPGPLTIFYVAFTESGSFDEQCANTRLISAAPDLLEAVRKACQLASIASDWNLYEVEIDGAMVGINDLKELFDAAISKAIGERET